MMRRKIVLQFITGADEDNNYRYKKKTIRNIRPDTTDEQMRGFISRYCSLTAYPLAEAVVVDERILVMEADEELIEVIPQEEQEGLFVKEVEDTTEKGVTTASFTESEATLAAHDEAMTPLAGSEILQEQDLENETVATSHINSPKLASTSQIEKQGLISRAAPETLTQKQVSLEQNIRAKNRSDAKNQAKSELKKQSPPLGAASVSLEPVMESTPLTKKAIYIEEEVIDASQALTVDDLLELVLKSERESTREKKLLLIDEQPIPTLQFLNQETELDLLITDEFSDKSLIRPVKKSECTLLWANRSSLRKSAVEEK